jgi:hypothetical protein
VGKTSWRPEPTRVENLGDDLWLGVKGQSNSVIAGSPRNAFRCSVVCCLPEVEHWIGDGPDRVTDLSQTPNAGKAPKRALSGKGCGVAVTTRRLA